MKPTGSQARQNVSPERYENLQTNIYRQITMGQFNYIWSVPKLKVLIVGHKSFIGLSWHSLGGERVLSFSCLWVVSHENSSMVKYVKMGFLP